MSPLLSTLIMAAAATAQTTTSLWMPMEFYASDVGYVASVVGSSSSLLTVALAYDDETDTSSLGIEDNTPFTVTVGPNYFKSFTTSTDSQYGDYTASLECDLPTMARAKPVCTISRNGAGLVSAYCAEYSSEQTEALTSTYEVTFSSDEFGPATTEVFTTTYDYIGEGIPDYCTEDVSVLPSSAAIHTETLSRSYIETYKVVITAGQEKLQATAGASVTQTGASSTQTVSSSTGTGSSSGTQASNAAGTPTGSSTVAAGTGAAAPMVTVAPALAGLGAAAMAAFLL